MWQWKWKTYYLKWSYTYICMYCAEWKHLIQQFTVLVMSFKTVLKQLYILKILWPLCPYTLSQTTAPGSHRVKKVAHKQKEKLHQLITDTENTKSSPQQVFIKPQTQAAIQTTVYVIICCQKKFVGFMISVSIPSNPKAKTLYSFAISAADPQLSLTYGSCSHVAWFSWRDTDMSSEVNIFQFVMMQFLTLVQHVWFSSQSCSVGAFIILSAALCWQVKAWRTEWGSCWFLPRSCNLKDIHLETSLFDWRHIIALLILAQNALAGAPSSVFRFSKLIWHL